MAGPADVSIPASPAPDVPPLADPARLRRPSYWPAAAVAMIIFAALSAAAGIYSEGFLEADACTHYLYSRFGLSEPHLLVDVWGRPFCTILYMPPALLGGRAAVRIFCMLLALAIGLVTLRIARNQGYSNPSLALIFLLGQPPLFLHSFSELTELPFALLVALALWAYQGRNWLALAILVGLMPTSRPEGFGFIAFAAMALLLHRRWYLVPILGLPLVLWSISGWVIFGMPGPWYLKPWTWLIERWPYADQSLYRSGYLVHFLVMLPAIVSPVAFPAVLLGVWRSLQIPRDQPLLLSAAFRALFGPDHRLRVQWVIALTALGVLAAHSLLYWAGRMASNGELRYLLVVSPMWALLAAAGWEWLAGRFGWRRPALWAGVGVLLSIFANRMYTVVPLGLTPDSRRAREVAAWYMDHPLREQYPRLIATCRDIYYFIDRSPSDPQFSAYWTRGTIRTRHSGIMIIWDPIYGVYNADHESSIAIDELLENGWIPIHIFAAEALPEAEGTMDRLARRIQDDGVGTWVVLLSPFDASGRPTDRGLEVAVPP
jgi:hypothetical protein